MSELTPEMGEFLNGVHFAVVATIHSDGFPHQTVMWYTLEEDGTLLLNTPFNSLKHRHVKHDNRISVCVEDGYRYLTLQGTVTINEDPQEAGEDYARLGQRYMGTFAARPSSGSSDRPAILDRPRVTLRMAVESVVSNRF
jgi:PPOX class probable F420-dependent enzyme